MRHLHGNRRYRILGVAAFGLLSAALVNAGAVTLQAGAAQRSPNRQSAPPATVTAPATTTLVFAPDETSAVEIAPASATRASGPDVYRAHQLLSGNAPGISNREDVVLRSQQQLEVLLRRLYSNRLPPVSPDIDFSQQVLVYFVLGTGMRGDDTIHIRDGYLADGVLHVEVEIGRRPEYCLGKGALTAPFALAALPFPASEVHRAVYRVFHKTYPCRGPGGE